MSPTTRGAKLAYLVAHTGHVTLADFVSAHANHSVVPGICVNSGNFSCNLVRNVHRAETAGYCDNCKVDTVESGLHLAGMT
jgi:hypothetical protein